MSNLRSVMSVLTSYLEKISNQPIISYLENGSLWILVDGNNSLNLNLEKTKLQKYSLQGHQAFIKNFEPTLSTQEIGVDQILKG